MTRQYITRATIENLPEQFEDLRHIHARIGRLIEQVADIYQQGLADIEIHGEIAPDTCAEGQKRCKKLHDVVSGFNGYSWITHHCLQEMLPEGVSEGNKC